MKTLIEKTLKTIKEQVNVDLDLCDYFTGVKDFGRDEYYFNVLLKDNRVSESKDFDKLCVFSRNYNMFRVEPCGLDRVSIIFKK